MTETSLIQFEKDFAAAGDSSLGRLQRAAFSRFHELGFPTTDLEEWRYTSVQPIAETGFRLGQKNGHNLSFPLPEGVRLVFVNGRFAADLSSLKDLPRGVAAGSLAEFLKTDADRVEKALNRCAGYQDNPFVALNLSFLQDGSCLFIPKGTVVEAPIHLVYYSGSGSAPTVSHPRNLIVAEEGSRATIIENYIGEDSQTYLTNAVTEILIGQNARIEHCKVQEEGKRAFHLSNIHVRQDREGRFVSHSLSFGSKLSRTNISTVLESEGAECALNGLYMAGGDQHVDNQTSIDHAKPHGTSAEIYKGILDGRASGVFNGRIVVRPDAQKTSAIQTNKNLLLSKDARINTKPLLEIHANDVKCNHGATIGRLDENAVFYLRSRGINEKEARGLLTHAFASDVIGRIGVKSLRNRLQGVMFQRLAGGRMIEEAA